VTCCGFPLSFMTYASYLYISFSPHLHAEGLVYPFTTKTVKEYWIDFFIIQA
jgi:hypothetical protein